MIQKGNEMLEVVKQSGVAVLLAAILVLTVSVFYGCQKSEPANAQQQAAAKAADANAATEQKLCPVLGNPIDKNVYTVYKGKKVYFCCSMCKPEFEKNPEKYISKLPQFAN